MATKLNRVELFDLSAGDADRYEDLVNAPGIKVVDTQTMSLKDGSVVRVVDFTEPASPRPEPRPVYTPPIC